MFLLVKIIDSFIKTIMPHPFAMADAQQHNHNSIGKNNKNVDQNSEEGYS